MFQQGYALIELTNSNAIVGRSLNIPGRFTLPDGMGFVTMTTVGQTTDAAAARVFKMVERWRDNTPPSDDHTEGVGSDTETYDAQSDTVKVSPPWRQMTPQEIDDRDADIAEKERRRMVPKLLIIQRLIAGGGGQAAAFKAALTGQAKEKWDARNDFPAGHVGLRALLEVAGADPDAILAKGEADVFD